MPNSIKVPIPNNNYYDAIREHCEKLGAKLLTPKQVFDLQGAQPTKRNVNIQLGCFHECVMSKMAFKVFEMKTGNCRHCENSDILELEKLTNQDIADGNLSQEQFESLDEDHYTLSCIRCKARTHGVPLADLVDIWLAQDGNCARCECKLFPTASTKSFYFVELTEDGNEDEDEFPNTDAMTGGFVCNVCRD